VATGLAAVAAKRVMGHELLFAPFQEAQPGVSAAGGFLNLRRRAGNLGARGGGVAVAGSAGRAEEALLSFRRQAGMMMEAQGRCYSRTVKSRGEGATSPRGVFSFSPASCRLHVLQA
jgi:hypothetical protein